MSPEEIMIAGFKKINDSISSDKMNKIIMILLIEMYRNPKVRDFYKKWYFEGKRSYVSKVFKKMMEKGQIKKTDPEILSNIYNALTNTLYQELYLVKADNQDCEQLEKKFEKQIALFLELIKK
jgi:hypothetical protein